MKPSRPIILWLALVAMIIIHCQPPAVRAQAVTFSTNLYNLNQTVTSVSLGDVNGNGKLDLISAEVPPIGGPATLVEWTNNGSGVFSSNTILYAGIEYAGTVPAGITGRGQPDLLFVSDYANTLTVVTNNGSGLFGSNATYSVGSYPLFVLAADVNGDDQPDLISVNYGDGTLTLLTNNGAGIFGSNAMLNVGSDPRCGVAVDTRGTGKPDLVCVNGNGLMFLTNNGCGVFGSNTTLNAGIDPVSVIAADVNGDGKPDLISATPDANSLTVFTNNGMGGFGSNTTVFVPILPGSVVAADLNGDGKMDLVCGGERGMELFLNTTPFPPPALNIVPDNHQVTLSWPGWATNYVLESTTNFTAPQWTTVSNSTPIAGGVVLTNLPPSAFFRLHQY